MRVHRVTADLSEYPDLVVILLGMRVRKPKGILRLLGVGPKLYRSHHDRPDGLLAHEDIVWSMFPPHWGARQYWRDLESLERWTRSEPHRIWWQQFLKDSGGTGFWHEAYFARGGIDSVYDDMGPGAGLAKFAPMVPARGRLFSTRGRVHGARTEIAPVVEESELYESNLFTPAIDLLSANLHAHIPGALTCCPLDQSVRNREQHASDTRPHHEHPGQKV